MDVKRNLNKMRLSPVWVAMVAIATPLGGSPSANAQTINSSKQTAEVFTPEINQAVPASEILNFNFFKHLNSFEIDIIFFKYSGLSKSIFLISFSFNILITMQGK